MTTFIAAAGVALLSVGAGYLLSKAYKPGRIIRDMETELRAMRVHTLLLERRIQTAEEMLAEKKHQHAAPYKRAKNKNASRRRRRRRR